MKKYILLFLFVITNILYSKAAVLNECATVKDSIKMYKKEGFVGFYIPVKYSNNIDFILINKDRYKRIAGKDKDKPLFQLCFNKESQSILDSLFKLDFFRKYDSILNAYDSLGKGYRPAEFENGRDKMKKFIAKNLQKPTITEDLKGVKPKVIYSVEIDENGNIGSIKTVKSNCKECESAGKKVIGSFPKYTPSTEAGTAKKTTILVPILF